MVLFILLKKMVGYAGASLKQRIWDFQKTSSKLDSLKIDEDIASLSLEDMKALMAYKIKSLYKLIVVQKEAIEVHKKDLDSKKLIMNKLKALEFLKVLKQKQIQVVFYQQFIFQKKI
jgi:hypothetical protein